jgi:Ca2+/Na+ antiporter
LCASQPLIIACGLMNIWAGLFVVWVAGALSAGQLERLSTRQDLLFLLLFFLSTFLLAGMVQLANHVTPLLALLGAGLALLLLVLVFRDYQFRKHYSGARP